MRSIFKILMISCFLLLGTKFIHSQDFPSSIKNITELKDFFSKQPQFKNINSSNLITISYTTKFVAYVNNIEIYDCEVEIDMFNPGKILITLPKANGFDTAPMLLTLNGNHSTLALLPLKEGENNIRLNSFAYSRNKSFGNKWLKPYINQNRISFRDVNTEPQPEIFDFIGFAQSQSPNT